MAIIKRKLINVTLGATPELKMIIKVAEKRNVENIVAGSILTMDTKVTRIKKSKITKLLLTYFLVKMKLENKTIKMQTGIMKRKYRKLNLSTLPAGKYINIK